MRYSRARLARAALSGAAALSILAGLSHPKFPVIVDGDDVFVELPD